MQKIRDELVLEQGSLYELIYWIIQNCGIAISPLIEKHWKTKCSEKDQFFWTWYGVQITNHAVHPIKKITNIAPDIKKKIHNDYKLPFDPFVIECIKCACSTSAPRYILADDIYFYEPTAKRLAVKNQQDIMNKRSGKLGRYIEKTLNIRIGTAEDFKAHFAMATGNCPIKNAAMVSPCPHLP